MIANLRNVHEIHGTDTTNALTITPQISTVSMPEVK